MTNTKVREINDRKIDRQREAINLKDRYTLYKSTI